MRRQPGLAEPCTVLASLGGNVTVRVLWDSMREVCQPESGFGLRRTEAWMYVAEVRSKNPVSSRPDTHVGNTNLPW